MPDRIVRANILTSDAVNSLSWPAEIFYRRLMSIADDFGRYDARPSILRAMLYPLKLDKVSEPDVVKWMLETAEAGLVRKYTVDGKEYLEINKFDQRLRAMKSKFPSPADTCCQMSADDGECQQPADICCQMPADDNISPPESESDTEVEINTVKPTDVGDNDQELVIESALDQLKALYKSVAKDKKAIYKFIKDHSPTIIEPYIDLWNLFADQHSLAKVQKINDQRRRKFRARIRDQSFNFPEILRKAAQSDFLLTGKWFGFDWIIENDSHYLKVLEGNYDKKPEVLHEAVNSINERLKAAGRQAV